MGRPVYRGKWPFSEVKNSVYRGKRYLIIRKIAFTDKNAKSAS